MSQTVTLSGDLTLTAYYEQEAVSNVTITVTGTGSANPAGQHTYAIGSALYVSAIETDPNWHYQKMRRNGVDWTASNPGEFLNLTATETIEVVFGYSAPITLVVTSAPIAVTITVDGYQYDTSTAITLLPGNHTIIASSNAVSGSDIYNFKQWNDDMSTNPIKQVNLTADTVFSCTYQLQVTPPLKGNVEIHAFLDTAEIIAPYEIVEAVATGNTPATVELTVGDYTVKVTYGETKTQSVTTVEGQTVRLDFQFTTTPSGGGMDPTILLLLGIAAAAAVL